MDCAECRVYACRHGDLEKLPENCPMRSYDQVYKEALQIYKTPEIAPLALNSARVAHIGRHIWTRVEDIMELCYRMNFRRLGLAFCIALRQEARQVNSIFKHHGFEVVSVSCKTGSVPKEEIGITEEEKNQPGKHDPMCNSIAQAKLLNLAKTDFNILLGLCVGHDTLFIKYAEAPVTVLAVKDRVLAHNPLGAIYASHYFKERLENHSLWKKEVKP